MAIKNLQSGNGGKRSQKIIVNEIKEEETEVKAEERPVIYEREQEKMTAEIADRFRIRVVDASAFKNSYVDWAEQWK